MHSSPGLLKPKVAVACIIYSRHRRMMKDPMDKFKAIFALFFHCCVAITQLEDSSPLLQAPMTESMNIGWHEEEVRDSLRWSE